MSANATRKLLAPMSTPTTCPYPALMRRAPFRRPDFDFPLEVLSSKPLSSRKETADGSRDEDKPQCRSEISPDSEACSRSCRITSPASICFISRSRCTLPGEERAGRNWAWLPRAAHNTKLSLFTKPVNRRPLRGVLYAPTGFLLRNSINLENRRAAIVQE